MSRNVEEPTVLARVLQLLRELPPHERVGRAESAEVDDGEEGRDVGGGRGVDKARAEAGVERAGFAGWEHWSRGVGEVRDKETTAGVSSDPENPLSLGDRSYLECERTAAKQRANEGSSKAPRRGFAGGSPQVPKSKIGSFARVSVTWNRQQRSRKWEGVY